MMFAFESGKAFKALSQKENTDLVAIKFLNFKKIIFTYNAK